MTWATQLGTTSIHIRLASVLERLLRAEVCLHLVGCVLRIVKDQEVGIISGSVGIAEPGSSHSVEAALALPTLLGLRTAFLWSLTRAGHPWLHLFGPLLRRAETLWSIGLAGSKPAAVLWEWPICSFLGERLILSSLTTLLLSVLQLRLLVLRSRISFAYPLWSALCSSLSIYRLIFLTLHLVYLIIGVLIDPRCVNLLLHF